MAKPAALDAIVQARMGSTRLFGKVLRQVMGKPLLWYVIERLKASAMIRNVTIATSQEMADDAIVDWANKNGIVCFRGSEENVLSRYYDAATAMQSEHVLRVTADCPLVDPAVCDKLAMLYFENSLEYARTDESYPDGLDCEIFSYNALRIAYNEAVTPVEQEHVTAFMSLHPGRFPQAALSGCDGGDNLRVTVDYPEDFTVVRAILEALFPMSPYFTCDDIIRYLQSHPAVVACNAKFIRDESYYQDLQRDGFMG